MRRGALCTLVVVATALFASGCAASQPNSGPDPQLKGTWHLVVATSDGSTVPSGAEEITLTIGDAAHTGGASPCSAYTASVTGGVGAVFISAHGPAGGSSCDDRSLANVDDEYLQALSATTIASIDDGLLVLSSPSSSLVYVKPAATSSGTLQNTTWSLVVPPDLKNRSVVRLEFAGSGRVFVTTSCSRSVARYTLDEDIITIAGGVLTTRARGHSCSPADRVASAVLTGQLTADVSASTGAGPAILVLTNRFTEQPLLWRAQ